MLQKLKLVELAESEAKGEFTGDYSTIEAKKKEIGIKGIIIMISILIAICILIGYTMGYLYLRSDYIEYLKRCICI